MKNNIWDKSLQLGIQGIEGAFSDKITPDINGFNDETVVQCDARVAKNTLVNDSKNDTNDK